MDWKEGKMSGGKEAKRVGRHGRGKAGREKVGGRLVGGFQN
jgi:hypothetical protein